MPPTIDVNKNPFPGPVPFTDEDEDNFFGREPEARELVSLLFAHRVIFLYAQSGVGKTSLLNAALIPLLRRREFEVLPVVRIGAPLPPKLAGRLPQTNVYILNTLFALQGDERSSITSESTIASCLADTRLDPESEQVRVLIFDQFEEFFTSHVDRWQERVPFFQAVGKALAADSSLRLLVILREEFLASLDGYEEHLLVGPAIRNRLERLGSEAAVEAVKKPMLRSGRIFGESVAELLVDKLLAIRVQTQTGLKEVVGEHVEPVHLQVVCRRLWQDLPEDRFEITEQDLQNFGDVNDALEEFYENAILKLVAEEDVSEQALRLWFERILITPALTRSTVFRGQTITGGLANEVIEKLETPHHVVRSEVRAGGLWYELTHDRLIEPIMQSNQLWRARLSREEQYKFGLEERALNWVKAGREFALLLGAGELAEADALRHESGLSETTQSFIGASHEHLQMIDAKHQRDRANREASMAQRFRRLSIAFGVACAVALVALGVAMYYAQRERSALVVANKANALAQRRLHLYQETAADLGKRVVVVMDQGQRLERDKVELDQKGKELQAALTQLKKDDADIKKHAREDRDKATQAGEEGAAALSDSLSQQTGAFASTPDIRLQVALHAALLAKTPVGKHGVGSINYLNQALQTMRPELLLTGHQGHVMSIAYSPNGALVATGGMDGEVILSDTHTGKFSQLSKKHAGGVLSVAFSADGRQLVTGGVDGSAIVWDLYSGTAVLILKGHDKEVTAAVFSPDGKRVATASNDRTVRIWTLPDGKAPNGAVPFVRLVGHDNIVNSVAWSPDGTLLASGSDDGKVKLWSTSRGREEASFDADAYGVVAVAFSPDGVWLATGGRSFSAKLWKFVDNAEVGKQHVEPTLQHIFTGHQKAIWSITFSPDNQYLGTSSEDGSIGIWSVLSNNLVQWVDAHARGVHAIDFSPDGAHLASAGNDGKAILWNLRGGHDVFGRAAHPGSAYAVAFSPDGRTVVSGGVGGTRVWKAEEGLELFQDANYRDASKVTGLAYDKKSNSYASVTQGGTVTVYSPGKQPRRLSSEPLITVAYSPDGAIVALGDQSGVVWIRSSTGELVQRLSTHLGKIISLAFSRDGSQIACVTGNGGIVQWNTRDWQHEPAITTLGGLTHTTRSRPLDASFNADLSRIVAIDKQGQTYLWDVKANKEIPPSAPDRKKVQAARPSSEEEQRNLSVIFSPDASLYAVGTRTGAVRIFETGSRRLLRALDHHQTDWVRASSFSPDGRLLATVSDDRSVFVWDIRTGDFFKLGDHPDWVIGVGFSFDGRSVATCSKDGVIIVWDVPSRKETQRFQENGVIMQVAFSPNGQYVTTASLDGGSHRWDVRKSDATASSPFILQRAGYGELHSVAFSPDGGRLALGATDRLARGPMDNVAKLVDVASGEVLQTFTGHTNSINGVVFSENGSRLVTGSDDKTAKIWNVVSGKQIGKDLADDEDPVTALVAIPRSSLIVTGSEGGKAIVWDIGDQKIVKVLKHRKGVTALAVSADGRWLATASSDFTMQVWDVNTWKSVFTFNGFADHAVKALSFAPDGKRLVAAGSDGTIKMFLLDKTKLVGLARDRINAVLSDEQCNLYLEGDACPKDLLALGQAAEAKALERVGDFSHATAKYQEALAQAPPELTMARSLTPNDMPEASAEERARSLLIAGMRRVQGNQVLQGIALLMQAEALDPSLRPTASELNTFCWWGALWNHADKVMDICRQASEKDPDNASIRDSKALAEALLGELKQAAKDFLPYALETTIKSDADLRRGWIELLEGGENPFSKDKRPDTLNKLRNHTYHISD